MFKCGIPAYNFVQSTPLNVWYIVHNFGNQGGWPIIDIFDDNGEKLYPLRIYHSPDFNATTITWTYMASGSARVVGLAPPQPAQNDATYGDWSNYRATPVVFFHDTFSDTNGTSMLNHVGETGHTYTTDGSNPGTINGFGVVHTSLSGAPTTPWVAKAYNFHVPAFQWHTAKNHKMTMFTPSIAYGGSGGVNKHVRALIGSADQTEVPLKLDISVTDTTATVTATTLGGTYSTTVNPADYGDPVEWVLTYNTTLFRTILTADGTEVMNHTETTPAIAVPTKETTLVLLTGDGEDETNFGITEVKFETY